MFNSYNSGFKLQNSQVIISHYPLSFWNLRYLFFGLIMEKCGFLSTPTSQSYSRGGSRKGDEDSLPDLIRY